MIGFYIVTPHFYIEIMLHHMGSPHFHLETRKKNANNITVHLKDEIY
jgi:hypothetical protein